MFRRLLRLFHAEPLKNTGSVARDMLASERTFLAWTRTGLGFIALGIAFEKVDAFAAIAPTMLHRENSRTKIAAGVLVGSGSICVAHGTARYFSTMRLLQQGLFRPNVPGVMGAAAASNSGHRDINVQMFHIQTLRKETVTKHLHALCQFQYIRRRELPGVLQVARYQLRPTCLLRRPHLPQIGSNVVGVNLLVLERSLPERYSYGVANQDFGWFVLEGFIVVLKNRRQRSKSLGWILHDQTSWLKQTLPTMPFRFSDLTKAYIHHTRRASPLPPLEAKRLATAQRVFFIFAGTGLVFSLVGLGQKSLAVRQINKSHHTRRDIGIYAQSSMYALGLTGMGSMLLTAGLRQHFTFDRAIKGGMFPPGIIGLGLLGLGIALGGPVYVLARGVGLLDQEL
nr:hypothetical protein CFP56_25928 [Quercus suber]